MDQDDGSHRKKIERLTEAGLVVHLVQQADGGDTGDETDESNARELPGVAESNTRATERSAVARGVGCPTYSADKKRRVRYSIGSAYLSWRLRRSIWDQRGWTRRSRW